MELRQQWADLGVDPERAMALVAPPEPAPQESFELWPEHERAWDVFMLCARQWRMVVGFGGAFYQGLETTATESAIRMLQVPTTEYRAVLRQLQILESEALSVLNT